VGCPLSIAYTPDSDDAFYYYGLEAGRIRIPGFRPRFVREPLSWLNPAAREGRYDVTAISSVLYPEVADRYAILSVGTSVGRGYGPVLVSKQWRQAEELRGRRVGVGGIPTTGWFLLRWLCPEALVVELPFDRIGEAVAAGDLDAGVMIHEELLYYPQLGLHRVVDLGAVWCRRHDLPLPVGLNIIRRDLGEEGLEVICAGIRRSLLYGQRHHEEALAWAGRFGRGVEGQCSSQFVEMFANLDSLQMAADVRRALQILLDQGTALSSVPTVARLDIIEGRPRPWRAANQGSSSWTPTSACLP
jgi:1,4-dihydroxy-6-naphthoate synthase